MRTSKMTRISSKQPNTNDVSIELELKTTFLVAVRKGGCRTRNTVQLSTPYLSSTVCADGILAMYGNNMRDITNEPEHLFADEGYLSSGEECCVGQFV